MNFHFAPVQGHTDAPYRFFHNSIYNTSLTYYTPFIRWEKDGVRRRDIKDFTSALNKEIQTIPQIIFRDKEELYNLFSTIKDEGARRIDLNMGCPFPLQTGHGRGAASIANEELAESVAILVNENPDIDFSVKIRLGMDSPDEWRILLPKLNDAKLSHITVHPRIARQQYSGDINIEQFERLLKESVNPIIYNGDIRTPEDIEKIINRFPEIDGIMIGRGLLGRPSLVMEYLSGKDWSIDERISLLLDFHRKLRGYYEEILCGDAQLLAKIKPFWEFSDEEIGRKAWKAIKKAGNIAKYNSAIGMIGQA